MAQRKRRGFTIVELVIVIAVIAILAGVLIPTFISVINKANVASDTSLVRNINEALVAEEVTEGKPATMSKALELAERNGFSVEKLTPRSTGDIVWNSASNRFALVDKDGNVVYSANDEEVPHNATVWKIAHKTAEIDQTYSTYLAYNVTEALPTFVTGVDVGANQGLDIAYAHSGTKQSVVINMNGGKLTVNAPQDDVYRHGTADSVVITAVAPTSYHECGVVQGNIELANGRVVFEKGASAAAVKVVAEANAITNGSAVIAVDNKEATTVSIVMAEEVKNAITSIGGNNKIEASEDSVVTDPTVIDNMSKFAGGLGTEASPYLIATAEQFQKIETSVSALGYYKLVDDIVLTQNYATISAFAGKLDGNGYSITANTNGGHMTLFSGVTNATIENLTLLQNETELMLCTYIGYVNNAKYDYPTVFKNINVSQGTYKGTTLMVVAKNSLLCSQIVDGDASFIDCHVSGLYANVSGVNYLGIIVGNYIGSSLGHDIDVLFDGCTFDGNFYSPDAGFLIGNCTSAFDTSKDGIASRAHVTVKNCLNQGTISYTNTGDVMGISSLAGQSEAQKEITNGFNAANELAKGTVLKAESPISGMSVSLDADKQIVITSDKEYCYDISFRVSTSTYLNNEQIGSHYFIVKNYIDGKSGVVNTGVYYNKVNKIGQQADTTGYVSTNANLMYKYDVTNGYTVNGAHDDVVEITSAVREAKDITVYIVVFEKNANDVLIVKGAIEYKG